MRFRVRYHRASDLVRDHDRELVKGGLLVRVAAPPELKLFDQVELELVGPDEQSWTVNGQVVQVVSGLGVAVVFDMKQAAGLAEAVAVARAAAPDDGPAPEHSLSTGTASESVDGEADAGGTASAGAQIAAKIRLALHGNKDERSSILRERSPSLHLYVLRNPQIQHDEILAIARNGGSGPELLKAISDRREWAQRSDVAIALVRNPKLPPPLAVKLLDFVGAADLRQLAKDQGTRELVRKAARKKVLE